VGAACICDPGDVNVSQIFYTQSAFRRQPNLQRSDTRAGGRGADPPPGACGRARAPQTDPGRTGCHGEDFPTLPGTIWEGPAPFCGYRRLHPARQTARGAGRGSGDRRCV